MISFKIIVPESCSVQTYTEIILKETHQTFKLTFLNDQDYPLNSFFFGFIFKDDNVESFLMTHEKTVESYQIPFAFPAFMAIAGRKRENSCWMVTNYYQLFSAFRHYQKFMDKNHVKVGLVNKPFAVKKGETIEFKLIYDIQLNQPNRFTSLIKKCAHHVLNNQKLLSKNVGVYTTNIANFEDAAYGLTNNLLDDRARILDGYGTFSPYAYLEKKPYSESFVLMDVAKGMYPFAIKSNRKDCLKLIENELDKMVDEKLNFPWIDDAHNTKGFFHLAWGGLPVGVTEDYIKGPKKGLFSDVDGHEEGPNLLSTWKYYYRVEILGEMALLSKKENYIKGFLKTLPFVNSLRMDNYEQPVTYDLDTHEPKTGKDDGGSAGGAAFWSIIHLTAYDLTKNHAYLDDAIKGLEVANRLDFDHYYSMRVAPKPVTVGWLVKANTYAYELMQDDIYLKHAQEAAKAIYFFYYLSPHPYTYFSTLGFGYACSRERWEAFLEMVESLYGLSFLLKYHKDHDLLQLFWYARENWLWALPLNGNPYGNLNRPYDSIGAEYVPYEFSTGSIGDNPGIDGGSQSSIRQIKEIYGSGEVYLAYVMFEMYAKSSNRKFLIVKSDRVNDLLNKTMIFVIYNTSNEEDDAVVRFSHLEHESYELYLDDASYGVISREQLQIGRVFRLYGKERCLIKLIPSSKPNEYIAKSYLSNTIQHKGYDYVDLTWDVIENRDFSHYHITVKNEFYSRIYDSINPSISISIDRELNHTIEIMAVGNNKHWIYPVKKLERMDKDYLYRYQSLDIMFDSKYLDLVDDQHLAMFYGKGKTNKVSLKIPVFRDIKAEMILAFELGSINDGCHYSVVVETIEKNYSYIVHSSNVRLYEFDLTSLVNQHLTYVTINVESDQGLGFSIKTLDILTFKKSTTKSLYLKDDFSYSHKEQLYTIKCCVKNQNFDYLELNIEGLNKDAPAKIFLNGIEALMEIEQQYPEKHVRTMNGIYRFKINHNTDIDVMIASQSLTMELHSIRLTNNRQYPKYAEYNLGKEESYEY